MHLFFAALLRLKKKTGASWTPLTTPEWLLQHTDRLNWTRFETPIAYHDSCHITKRLSKPEPARDLVRLMAHLVECVTCWESYREVFDVADVPLLELMVAAEQATRPEVQNE